MACSGRGVGRVTFWASRVRVGWSGRVVGFFSYRAGARVLKYECMILIPKEMCESSNVSQLYSVSVVQSV